MNPALLLDPRGARKKGNLYFLFYSLPLFTPSLLFNNFRSPSAIMSLDDVDLEMGDEPLYGALSQTSPLDAVEEWLNASHDTVDNLLFPAPPHSLFGTSYPDTKLTPHFSGEQAAQQSQTPPATPRFDPAALLNPKSAPKRPASSNGEEVERGRADPTIAGQVSLVERLHNVQERTASPAKRVKTTDEQQRKKAPSNGAHFGGSSALDLNRSGHTPVLPPPQVDLTMNAAKSSGMMWMAWTDPRKRQNNEPIAPGSSHHKLISMTLQLYCPRKNAHGIGKYLKNKNAKLTRPMWELERYDYFNPQTQETATRVQLQHPTLDPNRDTSAHTYASDNSDPLWKPRYRDNGRKKFIHVITGEEVELKPRSCRGGILADEMGLGKTLSILSLVADDASIKDGREFAAKKPPRSADPGAIQPIINSRATLLICPLSTMTNWKEQMKDHFPAGSALKWTRYHGSERFGMDHRELADHDIVITTYHIIAKDLLDMKRALPYINWFRIVLDEAHTIRNPTRQSKITCLLPGQRRWAVTGTPVQNRLEDLGALFTFINLTPFHNPHGFNHYILNPFKAADPEVVPKLQLLVSTVTIRRTKEIIKDEVPRRNDMIVRLRFSSAEQQLHDWFETDTERKVNAVTAGEKMGGHSYARILTAILNLRLICAHGRDLLSEEALKTTDGMSFDQPMEIGDEDEDLPSLTRQQAYEMLDLLCQTSSDTCAYCQKSIVLEVDTEDEDEDGEPPNLIGHMTPCYHIVCPKHTKKLSTDYSDNKLENGMVKCHFCEDTVKPALFELTRDDYQVFCDERDKMRKDPKLSKKINSYVGPHTKTQALLNDLAEFHTWSHDHPDERPIKSVVFSSWTTHLDLIEIALKNHSHTYVRLDGRLSREARDKSMRVFREDPSIRVMLVSIGAGGLGLNLTTANKVFMMEPQFNPAAEAQAVDRVHRLGQDREVTIKRFIMEESFEEKMLVLQEKKKALADLTMARERKSKDEATKQRLEELRSLFR
ncbi:hypothetical protein EKO04_008892 [Ascochyta lentis]|uniref:Uncharacterized protein n=1 Tax=Ascochyta lentis TaxID=205686 RepID=A0A8H7IUU1_9PLEO|nr:hypothetical protein EKO04_008892 [Ascochyta lentis]